MKELDFHEDTVVIRHWLEGKTFSTLMLLKELEQWSDYWKTGILPLGTETEKHR